MSDHGTTSDHGIDGSYIKFQTSVLEQMPRPEDISRGQRKLLLADRDGLKQKLHQALLPPQLGEEGFKFKNRAHNESFFMSLNIGTHKSSKLLLEAMKNEGFSLGVELQECLESSHYSAWLGVSKTNAGVSLVAIQYGELEMGRGRYSFWDVCKHAKSLGLYACSYEIAFQLRRKYRNQPIDNKLLVATQSFKKFGAHHAMGLINSVSDGMWVGGMIVQGPENYTHYEDNMRFVFALEDMGVEVD